MDVENNTKYLYNCRFLGWGSRLMAKFSHPPDSELDFNVSVLLQFHPENTRLQGTCGYTETRKLILSMIHS